MSFSLEKYKSYKQQLVNELTQLSFVLKDLKQSSEIKKVSSLKEQLANDNFLIAVVGEFSRGKSTFINALLGKKLLPSSAKPTTTILNTIKYSEDPYIHLHFHDETKNSKNISESEFASLVAPREPIPGDTASESEYENIVNYLQSIKLAEIGHPISFCKEGVTIIDTPGTNDLDAAREQITNNIIPQADAAILLLSAVKILSESEMSFLRDRILASDIQKIFIVVNFKDDLRTEEDQNKVLNTALTKLQPILKDVKLYLVSAKQALNAKRKANGENLVTKRGTEIPVWNMEQTGFVELEEALSDFLQYERGAVKLTKPIKRSQKIVSQMIKKQIQFERNALNQSIDNLQEKVEAFRYQLKQIRLTGQEALKILDFELSKEGDQLKSWYSSELTEVSSAGMSAFDANRYSTSSDELPNIVETTIAPLERDLHMEKGERFEKALQRSVEKASNKLNQEWARLDQEFQQTFSSSGEAGLSIVGVTAGNTTEGIIFFEDLLDELSDAWAGSASLIGKAFSGAGIALTLIAYGVFEIGRSFVSWLFGEDKTTKLRNEINSRLQSSKQNKLTAFKKEWRDITKNVKQQYEKMIEGQIAKKEQQLQVLMDNTQLEESQLQEKLQWLAQREQKLAVIYRNLASLEKELLTRREKVEV